jgi:hypothetical protein
VVGDRAGIAVEAFGAREGLMSAPTGPLAGVLCTIVLVVAQFRQGAVYESRFVHVAVTIVIETVAAFHSGFGGIAGGKPRVSTESLAGATAGIVGPLTGRPEPQGNRFSGAGTDTGIGHTLGGTDAIDAQCVVTGEPPWAVTVVGASTAAKGPLGTVVDTDIFGPAGGLAVVGIAAGTTEIGHCGDADIDDIRTAPQGPALPAGGTLLLAGDATDPGAEVINTESRLAGLVVRAGVEKATFARGAGDKDIVPNSLDVHGKEVDKVWSGLECIGQGKVYCNVLDLQVSPGGHLVWRELGGATATSQ